jgi:tetratricopeptide (TPR) repeat protein
LVQRFDPEDDDMKKHFGGLSWIIFFLFLTTTPSFAQENLSTLVNSIEPSIVVVLAYDKEGKAIGQANGFFISTDGDVITNRDVLEGANHAELRTSDGMLYPVRKVLAEDGEINLIRIGVEIPSGAAHPLSLMLPLPRLGERIAVIGSSAGPGKTASYGMVSAIQEIPAFGKMIRVTAPISSSFNACPVINMKGEVIGIVTYWMVEAQKFNFIVPSERVVRLKVGKGIGLTEWEGRREETAEGLYAKGLPFLWKEDYQKALYYFKGAVKKDPRYANAYFQIGYCNAQLGRYVEAFDAYKKAIQIKPDFVLAHFFLGLIYLEARDKTHALEEYKILKDLDRDYANGLFRMIY